MPTTKSLSSFFYVLLLLLYCLVACEEPVELSTEAIAPKMVVNGTFTPSQPFQISLTKNKDLLTNQPTEFITNARVSILNEQGVLLKDLVYTDNALLSYYSSPSFKPTNGATYQIEIQAPSFPTISAQDYIPMPVALNALEIDTLLVNTSEANPVYAVALTTTFSDPIGADNYYHLQLFYKSIEGKTNSSGFVQNTEEGLMPLTTLEIQKDNPSLLMDFNKNGVLFDDASFNGAKTQLKFYASLDKKEAGAYPKIIGELRTVSKNYYQYYTSITHQLANQDRPFVEPINVFTNIENGLGIFAGFSSHRDSIMVVQ